MSIAAIVLAAGASRRLGRPKQLLSFHGQTLLERAVLAAQNSLCQQVCVVLGANAEDCREALAHQGVRIVVNPDWEEGIASSIRSGVAAMTASHADLEGVIIMTCDQIALTSDLLNSLIAKSSTHSIVASHYAGVTGIPAYFAKSMFADLLALQGDQGARRLLKSAGGSVETVPFPSGELDIDTQEDWTAASARPLSK